MFESCLYGDEDRCDGKMIEERLVKGRNAYRCCECLKRLPVGEVHWRAKGVWHDGGWWAERTCESCHRVRVSLCHGFIFGELWASIREAYCHEPGDAEAMLPESYLRTGETRE
jgi:hypothetical protein